MNPILYDKNETDFSTIGIGFLSDTISCVVTQDAGCYELEMEYPVGGVHFESIQHSCWLKVVCSNQPNYSPQLFYIVHISKPLNKIVTILAHHVSYKLNFIPIKPFQEFEAYTVSDLFNMMKQKATEDFPFTFETDKGATPVRMFSPCPVMAMSLLGGSEGSLLDIAGGEFIWDNYKVIYKEHVGEDFGYELRYGVNITDLKQEENISETITGVVPYWYTEGSREGESDTLVMLPETTLYCEGASEFPFKRSVVVDFSDELEATYIEEEDDESSRYEMIPPSKEELRAACQEYISKAGIGVPKISIDVSMENLARSTEYEYLKPLQQVKLYDIVTVIFSKLNIKETAKVIKTVYDVQTQSYISISIGDRQNSLSDRFVTPEQAGAILDDASSAASNAVNKVNRRIDAEVNKLETEVDTEIAATKAYADQQLTTFDAALRNQIKTDIKNSTDYLMGGKGGYVVMHQATTTDPPHVDEILIMNTNNEQTASKIIRLNMNGIGFSSNGGQTWDSTWTIDSTFIANKINADRVNTYTLNAANINSGTIKTVTLQAVTIDAGGNTPSYIRSAVIEAGKYMTFNYTNNGGTTGRVTAGSGTVTMHLTANAGTTYTGQMFQSSNPGSSGTFVGGTRDAVIIDANSVAILSKGFAIGAEQGNHAAGITAENIENNGAVLILQNNDRGSSSNYSRISLEYGKVTIHWGHNDHQTSVFSSSGFEFGDNRYTRRRVGDLGPDDYVLAD